MTGPHKGNRDDGDADYLERTAIRLRHMTSSNSATLEGDADDVENRPRRMAYGGSRKRNIEIDNSA